MVFFLPTSICGRCTRPFRTLSGPADRASGSQHEGGRTGGVSPQFEARPQASILGFCVLGGIYSEGIDLKGDRLIGSIIVGVGLPQINPEQEVIRAYFEGRNHMGFAYAYQIPGMNKVHQAARRVIGTTPIGGWSC